MRLLKTDLGALPPPNPAFTHRAPLSITTDKFPKPALLMVDGFDVAIAFAEYNRVVNEELNRELLVPLILQVDVEILARSPSFYFIAVL